MSEELFSPAWVAAWREEILASERYRQGALRWRWPLLLVLRAAQTVGGAGAERAVFLDPSGGECRQARAGSEEEKAEFVLAGDAAAWRDVLGGQLDPVTSVLRGKLHLKKGHLVELATRIRAARALFETARRLTGGKGSGAARERAVWLTPRELMRPASRI